MSRSHTDLEAQRAEIADKLAGLKIAPEVAELVRQADKTMGAFKAEVATLENKIAEIDAQIGVREMDRRAAAAAERQDRWETLRRQLVDEEEVRLQAVADAESATRALVDAINRTLASNARMQKMAQQLSTTGKVPRSLSPTDLVSRLSGRISGLMVTVVGHRGRFGGIEWLGGSLYPPDRVWRADEERLMAAQLLQPLLEKGKA
jgi:hypothetical protein